MARFPYENLTKIRAGGETRSLSRIVREHVEYGTGGTCFSLVALFLNLARRVGLEAEPIMGDRPYGTETHCAVLIQTSTGSMVADPGYLIYEPYPPDSAQILDLPHTTLRVDNERSVYTVYPNGHEKFRYQLHDHPVSDETFRNHWEASFEWSMMDKLIVNRVLDDTLLYLRDTHLHRKRNGSTEQTKVEPEQIPEVVEEFGIDRRLTEEVLSAWEND